MAAGDLTATLGTIGNKPAADFDGVDDYVQIPHNAAQLGANLSNGFTISAWINPRSIGETTGNIIDKSNGVNTAGQTGFQLFLDSSNRVGFRINAGTGKWSSNNAVTYGTWTHILVTISSAQIQNLYINGAVNGAGVDAVQTISTITSVIAPRIGNRSGATDRTFDGSIRSVKMWNRVLTSAEITNDSNGLNNSEGQILWVPLTNDYDDKSVLGLTGTNSGSILTNTLPNRVVADTKQINLAATTDKLIVVPVLGRNAGVNIIGVERAAA